MKKKLEIVRVFQYLEVLLQNDGEQEAEINSSIDKAIKCFYALNKKFLSKKNHIKN